MDREPDFGVINKEGIPPESDCSAVATKTA
jgi:hypothetical protein